MPSFSCRPYVAVATVALLAPVGVGADDWPQFHGPRRDNVSRETGLLERWPSGGPARRWTARGLGDGFSSVAVAGSQTPGSGRLPSAAASVAG